MSELWDNPLYPIEERLEMAKGAIEFNKKVIANLRKQLKVERNTNVFLQKTIDELRNELGFNNGYY